VSGKLAMMEPEPGNMINGNLRVSGHIRDLEEAAKQRVAKLRQEVAQLNEKKVDFERQVRKLT